jgi:protein phosphatase
LAGRIGSSTFPTLPSDAPIAWWEELTSRGGEGIVVKRLDFITKGPKGLAQPALKCRGREYLRIIYGPDDTMPEHVERLRERGLGALALRCAGSRRASTGCTALSGASVHECIFAVLALQSQPIDPRR